MIVISYRITLLEPVLVTMLDGEPNSKTSVSYLPGTVLRGAVISAWLRGKEIDPAVDPFARTLFFEGDVRFLNGYPLQNKKENRSLPTPKSWQTKKGEKDEIHDFAHPGFVLDTNVQWSRVGAPFRACYDKSSSALQTLSPDMQVTGHTTRSRIKGRSTTEEGDIFRYVSLEAGQVFKAYVLLDAEAETPDREKMQQAILKHLAEISRLGGSRNAGYGRVKVSDIIVEKSPENAGWREFDFPLPTATETQCIVTLLSDTLLRDSCGKHRVESKLMQEAIAEKLPGAKIEAVPGNGRSAFMEEQVVGGFNRKWGLPLPQEQAFAMGSVFVMTLPKVDLTAIAQLEFQGVGERRAEGFGRVGVCMLPRNVWKTSKEEVAVSQDSASLTPAGTKILREMATRRVRSELDRLVLTEVQAYPITNAPSGSQISRLRAVVQKELMKASRDKMPVEDPINLNNVRVFLDSMREKAKDQYRSAEIDNQLLLSWLKDQLSSAVSIFERRVSTTKIGGEESELTEEGKLKAVFCEEYALRVIDGVLAQTAKEK